MTTKTPKATKAAATPKPKRISKPKADKITKPKKTPRESQLAAMLGRPEGVTIQQVQEAFGILPHSARALISVVGRKLGGYSAARPAKDEPLVYRLTAAG